MSTAMPLAPKSGKSSLSIPMWVGLLGAAMSGALMSVQARITSRLAELASGGAYTAGLFTVSSGALLLLVVFALSRDARRGFVGVVTAVRSRSLPWWALIGGLGGTFFLIVQGVAAGPLGLAMYTMAVVSGQILGGLLFDAVGLAGSARTSPTVLRAVGSLATMAAVGSSVLLRGEARVDVGLTLLALVAGVVIACVNGLNGRVQTSAGNVVVTALINHALGVVLILTMWLALVVGSGETIQLPDEPWLYAGGPIGALTMALAAAFVRVLGVLLLGLGVVAGQLAGALAIDLIYPPEGGVQASAVIGVPLTLAAVAVTYFDAERRKRLQMPTTS